MKESPTSCWIVTEGMAGTENQCLGIAEALGVTPVIKRVKLKAPWAQLSPWLRYGHDRALAEGSADIAPPWPDLVLASGRKSIGIALHIKKMSGGKTFIAQIQDPRISPKNFDLVAVPQHDPSRGDNVVVTVGAPNRITPDKLAAAAVEWRDKLAYLPQPRVAVLIGGSSKAHRMTKDTTLRLADNLLKLQGGLMITASRRTGEENTRILRDRLDAPHVFFWDGAGDNPYFGFLALADYIIVTEDSVSMTTEALTTGKPVYTVALEGGARRLDLFHKALQQQGYTRPFEGLLEKWAYTPPCEAQRVAEAIRHKMAL